MVCGCTAIPEQYIRRICGDRGKGLLIGAELAGIYRDQSKTLLGLAAKNGLMLLNAGTNVLRSRHR